MAYLPTTTRKLTHFLVFGERDKFQTLGDGTKDKSVVLMMGDYAAYWLSPEARARCITLGEVEKVGGDLWDAHKIFGKLARGQDSLVPSRLHFKVHDRESGKTYSVANAWVWDWIRFILPRRLNAQTAKPLQRIMNQLRMYGIYPDRRETNIFPELAAALRRYHRAQINADQRRAAKYKRRFR